MRAARRFAIFVAKTWGRETDRANRTWRRPGEDQCATRAQARWCSLECVKWNLEKTTTGERESRLTYRVCSWPVDAAAAEDNHAGGRGERGPAGV
jgi:hypothetical protein